MAAHSCSPATEAARRISGQCQSRAVRRPAFRSGWKAGIGNVRSVGMTKTGSLYFRTPANEVDIELVSIDLNSGRPIGAPARPPQSVTGTNLEAAWSPDGTLLAYLSERAGADLAGTIAIYSVTTRELRELPPLKLAWARGLSWAPDGRSLAFTALDLKPGFGLFRIDVNTGAMSPIAYPIPQTFQGPLWSRDGKRLYFQPNDGAIHEWDVALGRLGTISPPPERDAWRNLGPISVSPDGRWIASYDRPAGLLQSVVIRPMKWFDLARSSGCQTANWMWCRCPGRRAVMPSSCAS